MFRLPIQRLVFPLLAGIAIFSEGTSSLFAALPANGLSDLMTLEFQLVDADEKAPELKGRGVLKVVSPQGNSFVAARLEPPLKVGDDILGLKKGVPNGWDEERAAVDEINGLDVLGQVFELSVRRLTDPNMKSYLKFTVLVTGRGTRDKKFQELGLLVKKAGAAPEMEVSIQDAQGPAFAAGLRKGYLIQLVDGVPLLGQAEERVEYFRNAFTLAVMKKGSVKLDLISPNDGNQKVVVTLPPQSNAPPSPPVLVRGIGDERGYDGSKGTGPRTDFPLFLGPADEIKDRIKGDRRRTRANEVVTARVELYYFRDAHRVAQLLNRQVKSYNGAAVTQFERAAESARDEFEKSKFERRKLEQTARESAEELRNAENQLVRKVGELRAKIEKEAEDSAKAQNPQSDVKATASSGTATASASATAVKENSVASNSVTVLRTEVENLLGTVQTKRLTALRAQAAADRANDVEQNAAKEQFRREVSAAKVDPDTYVPGNVDSIDPVSQVSISVIGEGVLHLRGPRIGVNKIRYMIDQIDHPVGQVKIGVMTLQVNGENGPRMENIMRRIEGNVSRARFMAYVSSQLFTRAVVETANRVAVESAHMPLRDFIATQARPATAEQEARWKQYLEAFFGDDFLAEIQDVDPTMQLLNPRHKLLALHSMDTITLGEALFITALAKHSVREQILMKLQQLLECDLPEKEVQWILTNKIYSHKDPKWWGDAERGRLKTYENALLRYKFTAIRTYFERMYECGELSSNILNPLQREVVKLAQGISLEQALAIQREAMIQKRSLIREAYGEENDLVKKKGIDRMEHLDLYFFDQQIDELEEKHLNAVESLRGRKAAVDKLVKSVVIAIEDDVTGQFYDPALERIRRASWEWDVELAAIERTSVLTNNRAFGKVAPQATFEFDLPRRDIALAEALKAAYALQQDIGPLLGDPNFAALAKGFSNSPLNGGPASVKSVLPGLPSGTDQQDLLFGDTSARKYSGLELEKLVPDPAIYKFETGTGFEVRPVVQPDGQSVQFDFNYMYTTDLLEPVRSNEKHLGRVKRHFINTEVQLGNLEWREISRYEVALKAERNARGVPLLEDIPGAGVLFRPLPQAQKSLQKNLIIGQAAIYPTIEDLLSLKPANLCHMDVVQTLCDAETEIDQTANRFRIINDRMKQQVDTLLRSNYELPKSDCRQNNACDISCQPGQPGTVVAPHPTGPKTIPGAQNEPMRVSLEAGSPRDATNEGASLLPPQPMSHRVAKPVARPATSLAAPRSGTVPASNAVPRGTMAPISPDVPYQPAPPTRLKIPTQPVRRISYERPMTTPSSIPSVSVPSAETSSSDRRPLLRRHSGSKAMWSAPDVAPPRRVIAK